MRGRCEQIQSEFLRHMSGVRAVKPLGLSRLDALQALDERTLLQHVFWVSEGNRCEPGVVLVICRRAMEALCPEPEDGWLSAAYQYLCKRMYPASYDREFSPEERAALLYYVRALEYFFRLEQRFAPFHPMTDFAFLSPQEQASCAAREEYACFLREFEQQHVYALLRMGRSLFRYDLLAHIAGVHYVAMHVARSLARAGVPLDLALVSAAAVGHDLGKIGCRSSEARRIPYLHYYYTEDWFVHHAMPDIAHVAANHSTWDLELENLPVESAVLIYADYRVRRLPTPNVLEEMHIYTLQEAYEIILNMLDNVDEAKRARYRNVYAKLSDFERFLRIKGVKEDLGDDTPARVQPVSFALLSEQEAAEYWKYEAIENNIRLMNRLAAERSFGEMLEAARSETDWKNIRAYLNILEEYHSYMTQRQKVMTLSLLYELLMHSEGDIRRQSAALMGLIIVTYDVEYRKELPEGVLREPEAVSGLTLWDEYSRMILHPDHKITDRHKSFLRFTLKLVLDAVMTNAGPEHRRAYLEAFLNQFRSMPAEDAAAFIQMDCVTNFPLEVCNDEDIRLVVNGMGQLYRRDSVEVKASILRSLKYLYTFLDHRRDSLADAKTILAELDLADNVTLTFLRYEIAKLTGAPREELETYRRRILREGVISDVCLENLKSATPWIIKEVNIRLLVRMVRRDNEGQALLVATHLSNLVKAGEKVVVRHQAGMALELLAPVLPPAQRNEIAVELLKGLETGQYEYAKYVPQYLGPFCLYLPPEELNEFIGELDRLVRTANDKAAAAAVDTVGFMLQKYPKYAKRFGEDAAAFEVRRTRLLGLVMCGLAHYHEPVSREAFLVMARGIFAGTALSFEEKARIFSQVNKKMLTLIGEERRNELMFFNRAASLNHIYRFLTRWGVERGGFALPGGGPPAYFPGTFDPFSLSHKAIVSSIRGLGYEVYLALDEFSWSKKTQPRMQRRKILLMSTADMFGVYLFPDDIPVNIASPRDIRRLRDILPHVNLVVGSDVVLNASSYTAEPGPDTVHSLDHILFLRNTDQWGGDAKAEDTIRERVRGSLTRLELSAHLEDVSSTRIRENIDLNRDIVNLIDPVAQQYIYDNSLYLREPQYKPVLYASGLRFRACDPIAEEDIAEAAPVFTRGLPPAIVQAMGEPGMRMLLYYHAKQDREPAGFLCLRDLDEAATAALGEPVAAAVRAKPSAKRALLLRALAVRNLDEAQAVCQTLLTQALAHGLREGYTAVLYQDARPNTTPHVAQALERQGFVKLAPGPAAQAFYVDMHEPVVLLHDVDPLVKEPLRSDAGVIAAEERAHQSMQRALAGLYPGELILSFSSRLMNAQLIQKITKLNGVPGEELPERRLGKYMCVPYGKILRDVAFPNTVTKTLHVEKVYDETARSFTIRHYPNYSPLRTQVETLRSFGRPLLLVDDLLHTSNRVKELTPLFREFGVPVGKFVCAILTAQGKQLMADKGYEAESAYFLPRMRLWVSESNLYPFVGGDSSHNSGDERWGSINSVNMILPYVMPRSMPGCTDTQLVDFSMVCLENTLTILTALERAYREYYGRNLTLARLGEAFLSPRRPDKGECMAYDGSLLPSAYVESDICHLTRLDPRLIDES